MRNSEREGERCILGPHSCAGSVTSALVVSDVLSLPSAFHTPLSLSFSQYLTVLYRFVPFRSSTTTLSTSLETRWTACPPVTGGPDCAVSPRVGDPYR